jgi:hypothetical protein
MVYAVAGLVLLVVMDCGWDRIEPLDSVRPVGGVVDGMGLSKPASGQEDDDWEETVKAVDKVLGVEQDPVKRKRDEKIRRDMEARGENPDEEGCAPRSFMISQEKSGIA